MVRLVFRPYTQIRRSICTSEPLRASTRVSSGFTLFRHSSPSFGSQHICSYSRHRSNNRARSMLHLADHTFSLSLRIRVCHPNTRIHVRLLGPCFKTGGLGGLARGVSKRGRARRGRSRSMPAQLLTARKHGARGFLPNPFPSNNFTYCFTLFSKCFSSFHHCTCSLSVSRRYLALDGVYHLLELHSQTTRLIWWRVGADLTGLSPSMAPCSNGLLNAPSATVTMPKLLNMSFCRFTRRY